MYVQVVAACLSSIVWHISMHTTHASSCNRTAAAAAGHLHLHTCSDVSCQVGGTTEVCRPPLIDAIMSLCVVAVGLEEGSRLPAALQLDPGASGNAATASKLQQLPSSLTDALKSWSSDSKLQVGC